MTEPDWREQVRRVIAEDRRNVRMLAGCLVGTGLVIGAVVIAAVDVPWLWSLGVFAAGMAGLLVAWLNLKALDRPPPRSPRVWRRYGL